MTDARDYISELVFLLTVVGALATTSCDTLYLISGEAAVPPDAVRRARLPALVCLGRGGPLESSGVYGSPLDPEGGYDARVFCSVPPDVETFDYQKSVINGRNLRNVYVYVWLEHREELADMCKTATTPVIAVSQKALRATGSQDPAAQPCLSSPGPKGVLGYGVAFRTGGTKETLDISVRPNGYP